MSADLPARLRGAVGARLPRRIRQALPGVQERPGGADARGDRPAAVFARCLDGDHLWLAVVGVPAETRFVLEVPGQPDLALEPDDGHVLPVDEAGEAGVAVRASLTGAGLEPGHAPGAHREGSVVARLPGGTRVAVWIAPLTPLRPTRTPVGRDGPWLHEVGRAPDGTLQVRTTPQPPSFALVDVDAEDDHLVARARPRTPTADGVAAGDVTGAVLLGDGGAPLAELPVTLDARGDVLVRVPADAPVADGAMADLALVCAGRAPLGVRRPHHQMAFPDLSLVLPGVHDGSPADEPALRWRWRRSGDLAVFRRESPAP